MGNNLTPYSLAVGYENVYFTTPYFKFIKRELIDDDKLLETNEDTIDLFIYLVSNYEKDTFRNLRFYKLIQIMIRTLVFLYIKWRR